VFTRPIGIIHRKGKVFSAAAREFVNLLTSAGALLDKPGDRK
jgi:hypothetical protein